MVRRKRSSLSIADLRSPEGSRGSPVKAPLFDAEKEDDEDKSGAVDDNSRDGRASEFNMRLWQVHSTGRFELSL